MAGRRPPVRLAAQAKEDFQSILADTQRRWGVQQRRAYREALNQALDTIGGNPRIGRRRDDDLGEGVRSFVVRQHSLLYRVEPKAVRVPRIIHGRQSLEGKIDQEEGDPGDA